MIMPPSGHEQILRKIMSFQKKKKKRVRTQPTQNIEKYRKNVQTHIEVALIMRK